MGDLIERQVAIDAMCKLMNSWFGDKSKDEQEEIKWIIKHLPSVQLGIWKSASVKPETEGMYLTLWGLTEKSRLRYKLLYYGTCEDWNDFFIKKSGWWDFDYGYGVPDFIDNDNVRYWMELPDLPEVDEWTWIPKECEI